jgi:hypothetical protein
LCFACPNISQTSGSSNYNSPWATEIYTPWGIWHCMQPELISRVPGHLLQCSSSHRYTKCLVIADHHWKSTTIWLYHLQVKFSCSGWQWPWVTFLSSSTNIPSLLYLCLSVCLSEGAFNLNVFRKRQLSLSLPLSLSSGYRVFVSNWFRTTASRKFSHLSRLPSCLCFTPCWYLVHFSCWLHCVPV